MPLRLQPKLPERLVLKIQRTQSMGRQLRLNGSEILIGAESRQTVFGTDRRA
jgi:hypothetical protein